MRKWRVGVCAATVSATIAIWPQNAQRLHPLDPLTVASEFTSLMLENERVRVLSVEIPPGQTVPFHKVMRSVLVALDAGKAVFRHPDGTTQEVTFRPAEAGSRPVSTSSVLWDDPVTYSIQNQGDTTIRFIRVETK